MKGSATAFTIANKTASQVDGHLVDSLWDHISDDHYDEVMALQTAIAREQYREDYGKVQKATDRTRKKLEVQLTESQRQLFGKYQDEVMHVECIEERAAFALGVAIGLRLGGGR